MKIVDVICGQKLLSLVCGPANAEPVVLVDEPSGRAMGERPALTALIAARKAQNLAFAESIANHYLVMEPHRAGLAAGLRSSALNCWLISRCDTLPLFC